MLFKLLRFILKHPLTKTNKFAALKRLIKWQLGTKLLPYPVVYPFVENTRLLAKKGMAGATGNIYCGLHDFEEMGFLLHFLRSEDVFADIGANIGSYTILASGVIGARSISFEPVPSTFYWLNTNVSINNIQDKVKLHNMGLGEKEGELFFSANLDTVNHALASNEVNNSAIKVNVGKLDTCTACIPNLIKMDVEGFEYPVLLGSENTLQNSQLKAIIIEINGSGGRYGYSDSDIHAQITKFKFLPYLYDPFTRKLKPLDSFNRNGNTIYLRDVTYVEQRLQSQRKFKVLNVSF